MTPTAGKIVAANVQTVKQAPSSHTFLALYIGIRLTLDWRTAVSMKIDFTFL
jgi:hypothetical protein